MAKIKELIKYLKTLPQETDVYVVTTSDHGYMGISANHDSLEIDINTEFVDLRNNPFSKGTDRENNIKLYLGEV